MSSWVAPIVLLLLPAAPLLVLCGLALEFVRRRRGVRRTRAPLVLAVGGLAAAGLFFLSVSRIPAIELWCDRRHLEGVQRRAAPIVAAMQRFESEHGRRAESFDELVPAYLAAVPGTGWSDHPRFEFGRLDSDRSTLYVSTPRGWIDFDYYFYAPEQVASEDDGLTTRLGDWVYYDE